MLSSIERIVDFHQNFFTANFIYIFRERYKICMYNPCSKKRYLIVITAMIHYNEIVGVHKMSLHKKQGCLVLGFKHV